MKKSAESVAFTLMYLDNPSCVSKMPQANALSKSLLQSRMQQLLYHQNINGIFSFVISTA
jgi:hypothetical protein